MERIGRVKQANSPCEAPSISPTLSNSPRTQALHNNLYRLISLREIIFDLKAIMLHRVDSRAKLKFHGYKTPQWIVQL